jgi:hypothetical protein
MNNLLTQKNEESIKQNSADFYTLSIYSKNILDYDTIRINEYRNFCSMRKRGNLTHNSNKYLKYTIGGFLSAFLMYRFKSVLIIPIFFSCNCLIKYFLSSSNHTNCYFCLKNQIKTDQLDTYEKYYSIISYIVDKNPSITTLDDFEEVLDKSISQFKL